MSEWQPIETAPPGKWVIVFGEAYEGEDKNMCIARAVVETIEWWEQVSDTRKELRTRTETTWPDAYILPTHWQPLPAPPTPSADTK